ncbi:hypothetical protein SNEBB_008273 [Seison nebaliae]|nr:hypothetical protein SNEBB_008273 [Seison nebaliae]
MPIYALPEIAWWLDSSPLNSVSVGKCYCETYKHDDEVPNNMVVDTNENQMKEEDETRISYRMATGGGDRLVRVWSVTILFDGMDETRKCLDDAEIVKDNEALISSIKRLRRFRDAIRVKHNKLPMMTEDEIQDDSDEDNMTDVNEIQERQRELLRDLRLRSDSESSEDDDEDGEGILNHHRLEKELATLDKVKEFIQSPLPSSEISLKDDIALVKSLLSQELTNFPIEIQEYLSEFEENDIEEIFPEQLVKKYEKNELYYSIFYVHNGRWVKPKLLTTLDGHTASINCVRFSPADSRYLATCGTDHQLLIWRYEGLNEQKIKSTEESEDDFEKEIEEINDEISMDDNNEEIVGETDDDGEVIEDDESDNSSTIIFEDSEDWENIESWKLFRTLNQHSDDILDVCWSSDGERIVSCGGDQRIIIWNVKTGKPLQQISDSPSIIRGITMTDQFIAAMTSNRTLRIYSSKKRSQNYYFRFSFPRNIEEEEETACTFQQDSSLFFRRISFSPDGNLLLVCGGCMSMFDMPMKNCSYLFHTSDLKKPICSIPSGDKPSSAVCWCPIVFDKLEKSTFSFDEENFKNLINIPYRMLFSIVTKRLLTVFDTQQLLPLTVIELDHYSDITDICWSADASLITLTSCDGYISFVHFYTSAIGFNKYVQSTDKMSEAIPSELAKTNEEIVEKIPQIKITSAKSNKTIQLISINNEEEKENESPHIFFHTVEEDDYKHLRQLNEFVSNVYSYHPHQLENKNIQDFDDDDESSDEQSEQDQTSKKRKLNSPCAESIVNDEVSSSS